MRDIILAAIAGGLLVHGAHLLRDRIVAELRIRRARRAREKLLARVEARQQAPAIRSYPGLPLCDGNEESTVRRRPDNEETKVSGRGVA